MAYLNFAERALGFASHSSSEGEMAFDTVEKSGLVFDFISGIYLETEFVFPAFSLKNFLTILSSKE